MKSFIRILKYFQIVLLLSVSSVICKSFGQEFIVWDTFDTFYQEEIFGSFSEGTVHVTSEGYDNFTFSPETFPINLNGANSSESFSTYGAADTEVLTSITFEFSTPVYIHSFNVQDIDKQEIWHDGFKVVGVNFNEVVTGNGVEADDHSITYVPDDNGDNTEYVHWKDGQFMVDNFTVQFKVTDNKTSAYLAYSLEVSTVPKIEGGDALCQGEPITLQAPTPAYSTWINELGEVLHTGPSLTFAPGQNMEVRLVADHDTLSHEIVVFKRQEIFPSDFSDIHLCEGESVQVDANLSSDYDYAWADGHSGDLRTFQESGTFTVIGTNGDCVFTDEFEVNVTEFPEVNWDDSYTICEGESVELDASNSESTYEWSTGEESASLEISKEGTYSVRVTRSECTTEAQAELIVNPIPEVEIIYEESLCSYEDNFIEAEGNYELLTWDNGTTDVRLEISDSGIYSVEVEKNGCKNQAEVEVFIEHCTAEIMLPNVFTPNGDFMNDAFEPVAYEHVKSHSLAIHNRWGQEVHFSKNEPILWDGGDSTEGVYFYTLVYTDFYDQTETLTGSLTLKR